jgi:hypothetical protein
MVMWEYIETFVLVFATDILYIYYVKAVTDHKIYWASFWSMVVTLTASVAVINYTENHWTLVASLAGAGAGTYIGMRYFKK